MEKKNKAAEPINIDALENTLTISLDKFYEKLCETLTKNNVIQNREELLNYGLIHRQEILLFLNKLGFYGNN